MTPSHSTLREINSWLGQRASTVAVVGGVLLAAIMIYDLAKVAGNWREADGYEYLWIAESIAQVHGFSFRGDRRPLFSLTDPADETDPARFYPTAWEEPLYPYLLGAYLWAFGEHGRLLMLITNCSWAPR